MTRFVLVMAVLAAIALCWLGMAVAWRRRVADQAGLAMPLPLSSAGVTDGPWDGKYLGATRAGEWLGRVDVHGLGARSLVRVTLTTDGVDIARSGSRSFHIPFGDLLGVRADKAIAGRAYEDGGIIVLTFRLGGTPIDIGLRFPDTDIHLHALATITHHLEATA